MAQTCQGLIHMIRTIFLFEVVVHRFHFIAGMPLTNWRVFPYHIPGLPDDDLIKRPYKEDFEARLLEHPELFLNSSNPIASAHGPTIYL